METTTRGARSGRPTNLRVCPSCWATVHRDELDQHEEWHERLHRDAMAEALRLLGRMNMPAPSLAG